MVVAVAAVAIGAVAGGRDGLATTCELVVDACCGSSSLPPLGLAGVLFRIDLACDVLYVCVGQFDGSTTVNCT